MQLGGTWPADELPGQLQELRNNSLFRQRLALSSPRAGRVTLNGKELLNFCSNDYLGLAQAPRLVECFQKAAGEYGVGSGASPLVCGRSLAHADLEAAVAKFTGRDRAIVFSSGYLANLAIISSLARARGDVVFEDKLNHASMIDGALLSRASLRRYPHCDPTALQERVVNSKSKHKLILTDSVFSMDGDVAPIRELATIGREYGACLAVDDAHGFGVFGARGAGILEQLGMTQEQVPLMMATFGKALGCAGAFVAGPGNLIEFLVQKARPYIYSTALAPALAVAATESLTMLGTEPWRRRHLHDMVARFCKGAAAASLPLSGSSSPIQPLLVGSAALAVKISDALLQAGILIMAIRPPTVPAGTSRLRITISAGHTEDDIDRLLMALAECFAVSGTKR